MAINWVRSIFRVIFWRYERGTWQYDIMVAVILAFIFFTPKTVFDGSLFTEKQLPQEMQEEKDPESRKAETRITRTAGDNLP